jgi:hypothetical protein
VLIFLVKVCALSDFQDNIRDAAFLKIMLQNRGKTNRLCLDIIIDVIRHNIDSRNSLESYNILTRKDLVLL